MLAIFYVQTMLMTIKGASVIARTMYGLKLIKSK
nr:MAG TPA: hypothetical protein [Caudoviricetes sp.]